MFADVAGSSYNFLRAVLYFCPAESQRSIRVPSFQLTAAHRHLDDHRSLDHFEFLTLTRGPLYCHKSNMSIKIASSGQFASTLSTHNVVIADCKHSYEKSQYKLTDRQFTQIGAGHASK